MTSSLTKLKAEFPDLFAQVGENPNIVFIAKFREFGIRVDDGGSAVWVMNYCPWSGKKLPSSLRDEWFDRIWALGFEVDDDEIPDEYRGADWWQAV